MSRRWTVVVAAVAVAAVLNVSDALADDGPQPTPTGEVSQTGVSPSRPDTRKPFDGARWEREATGQRSAGAPAVTDEAPWTLAVQAVDRAGRAVDGAWFSLYDLHSGAQAAFGYTGPGRSVRLPAGRYAISGYVATADVSGTTINRTLIVIPEVAVMGDMAITLDARMGQEVSASLDEPRARQVSAAVFVYQRADSGQLIKYSIGADDFGRGVYVTPTPRRDDLTTYVYSVWRRSDAPHVYNLITRTAGQVPGRLSHHWRTADLAAVEVRYPAQGVAACGGTYIGPYLGGARAPLAYGTTFPLPTRRIEYYSPHAVDVTWQTELAQTSEDCSFDPYDIQVSAPSRYPRPGRYDTAWNTAPLAPTPGLDSDGQMATVRRGDVMFIGMSAYSDSQRGHSDQGGPYAGVAGRVDLYRGEELVGSAETLEQRPYTLPPGSDRFRVVMTAERKVAWSALATRTEASWSFRSHSAGQTPQPLPLLDVRYRMAMDDLNRVTAGCGARLSIHISNPVQAQPAWVGTARLSVSSDEGVSWRPVPLLRITNQWHALMPCQSKGSVSLRLTASDRLGSSTTQTLINAYAIG